jgi:hypothetical protein
MSVTPSEWPQAEQESEFQMMDPALFEAIDWHLLKAQLTPAQGRCLDKNGWFDLVWRAQWLVLRVYADRYPTVDAHQLEMKAGYLCSYDVRRVGETTKERPRFPTFTDTPVGLARRVMEAHRRGTLKGLLEAAERTSVRR